MAYTKYYPAGWVNGSQGGTPVTKPALDNMDQGIADAHSLLTTKVERPATAINTLTGWYHADGFTGVDKTGATDSTAGLQAWLDALPSSGGGVAYLPQGVYLCNTVTSARVLQLASKSRITIRGGGNGATIRTTTAVADDLLQVRDCNLFRLENVFFEAQGTSAEIQRAVHVTTSSPGSAGRAVLEKLYIRVLGNFRKAYDISCSSGSPTIWSAQAAFTGADVGASVMLNLSDGPFTSRITAASTVTATLAAGINSSQTSVTLNAALPGAPASGFTIQIDNERMYVSAGGNTTTLTVSRARGNKAVAPAASHSSGATVSTSTATLANNATVTVSNSVVPARIQDANTSVIHVGVGIGCDNPGASNMDIAGNIVRECAFNRCHKAAVQVGNGTSGNTLDHRAYALSTFECGVGVWMYGGALSVHGGECSLNLVDFKQVVSASQDLVIEGVRSENAAVFWELTGSATAGSAVKLASIEVASFNAEDGVVIRHQSSRPLTLDTLTLKNIDTATGAVYCSVAGTPSNPCTLAVTGPVSSNGQNSDLFPASSSLVRTIFASPRLSGSNFIKNTVVGALFDSKVHMLGGVVRGRTTVADAAYTVLVSDALVVYTSLTAARVVTLPAQGSTLPAGQEFVVKDESGSCDGTKTITITPPSGTIDGAANVVINAAYGSKTIYTNGTNWFTR